MAIEIVNFPIKNCDFPSLCDSLPEGNKHHLSIAQHIFPGVVWWLINPYSRYITS